MLTYHNEIGRWVWDNCVEESLELRATDEELLLLRALALFSPAPGLSAAGRALVRRAQAFYTEALAAAVRRDGRARPDRLARLLLLLPHCEVGACVL